MRTPDRQSQPAPAKRATLADVAAAAGVSRTTASDILSDKPAARLYAAATREHVLRVGDQLRYRPHSGAQRLSMGRTNLIGLVLTRSLTNPFYARFATAVEREVQGRGMRLQLATCPGMPAERDDASPEERVAFETGLVRQMVADEVEGLIVGPMYERLDLSLHEELLGPRFPTVLFGQSIPEDSGYDSVSGDLAFEMDQILSRLRETGHRRFGFLAAPPARLDPTRIDHFLPLRMLRDQGLLAGPQWVAWQPDVGVLSAYAATAEQYFRQWLDAPTHARPTAVLCLNDQVALATLGVCSRLGIRVPDDVSLVGRDNSEESAHLVPPLTTVDLNIAGQVQMAVDRLLERIKDRHAPPRAYLARPQLVWRETVGPPQC